MINLPVEVLEALEKILAAEDEFIILFKAVSISGSGKIVVPPDHTISVHTNLLVHIIAHLVDAQTRITQLEGQIAILNTEMENIDAKRTNAKDN